MSINSKVFLTAAEYIFTGEHTYSCCAINVTTTKVGYGYGLRESYSYTFAPNEGRTYGFWLDKRYDPEGFKNDATDEARNWRLTALCFAAVMDSEEFAVVIY